MREKFNFSRLTPFAVAVVLYTLLGLLYFAPQLGGDVLVQGDITQYKGMSQEINLMREATGEDPQWTGAMFGGMPAYQISIEYPSQIIKRWIGGVTHIIDTPAAFIIFAMLSMWLMLVMMGVNGYVAIVGGAMYGLSTYFMLIIEAGHLTKMWALVYAPAMMGAIYAAMRGGRLWSFVAVALFTSLELGASHPQITYYFLMAAAALWISECYFAWQGNEIKRFARRTALLCAAGLLGLLSNLSPLWYTAEHASDTMRGGSELVSSSRGSSGGAGLDLDYATAWSYGRAESFNMLIPDFMGRDSATPFSTEGEVSESLARYGIDRNVSQQLPSYWGRQPFTAGPTYLGAVVIFMACVGFILSRGRERWWILGISVVMLLLAWGSNFMWFTKLMFDILPGYNKFRTVSMTLVVLEWTAPLLASYALAQLWRGEIARERLLRGVAWSAGLTAGGALLLALAGGIFFDFGYVDALGMLLNAGLPEDVASDIARAMVSERSSIMASDALRTAIYITLAAGAVVAFAYKKISRGVLIALIGVLATIDLVGVNLRFLSHDTFTSPRRAQIVATEANREIMRDRGESGDAEYRVLNLSVSPFNDATTSYFHRSVGGYHGAKLSRYQDIIDNYLVRQDSAILDMLNTRYVISPQGQEVILRPSALGAAWLVEGVVRVSSPNEEIAKLREVDLSKRAIISDNQPLSQTPQFGAGEIEMEEYRANYQRYRYSADAPTMALFSEIHYDKGWRVYIDGVEFPYLRANYILRAMELPAGEHTIEWRFKAPRWGAIEGISLVASIAILILMIVAGVVALGVKIPFVRSEKESFN